MSRRLKSLLGISALGAGVYALHQKNRKDEGIGTAGNIISKGMKSTLISPEEEARLSTPPSNKSVSSYLKGYANEKKKYTNHMLSKYKDKYTGFKRLKGNLDGTRSYFKGLGEGLHLYKDLDID